MNKSVDQTSGVLRALSMTGRTTAEDLQENLKMILGDPKRDVGMQIYLDMMQRSSGQAGTNAKQQGVIFDKEATKAYQALSGEGGLGIPNLSKDQIKDMLSSSGGREQLNSMLTTFQSDHPDVDAKKFQVAQGALNTASDEGRRSQLMDDFAKGKISAVDYQSAQAGLGKSAQVQANENLSAAKEVMRHSGIGTNKLYEEGGIATTQKAQQLLQAFGLSPTLLRDVQMALQNQGQGRLKAALGSEGNAEAVYQQIYKQLRRVRRNRRSIPPQVSLRRPAKPSNGGREISVTAGSSCSTSGARMKDSTAFTIRTTTCRRRWIRPQK